MNNEENKNQDLTYDFNFENQVAQQETNYVDKPVETLNDSIEEFEEINEEPLTETEAIHNESETLESLEDSNEVNENEVKKIKFLNKEFNYEDIILILIGLVIVASIFLLPRIMNLFN